MKSHSLLLGTNNPGKIIEMEALLAELDVELLTPAAVGVTLDVTEDGQTYAENATLKAQAFCRLSGLPVLADDSGLEVDALQGRPGMHSHRFAPQANATDSDRRHYLLEQLRQMPRPWTARFRATVAVARPGEATCIYEGSCEGEIIQDERGTNGFGYDPIFLFPETGHTMAELSLEEKNRLSHRARAVKLAIPHLKMIFKR